MSASNLLAAVFKIQHKHWPWLNPGIRLYVQFRCEQHVKNSTEASTSQTPALDWSISSVLILYSHPCYHWWVQLQPRKSKPDQDKSLLCPPVENVFSLHLFSSTSVSKSLLFCHFHPSIHGLCFVTLHVCTCLYMWTDRSREDVEQHTHRHVGLYSSWNAVQL